MNANPVTEALGAVGREAEGLRRDLAVIGAADSGLWPRAWSVLSAGTKLPGGGGLDPHRAAVDACANAGEALREARAALYPLRELVRALEGG